MRRNAFCYYYYYYGYFSSITIVSRTSSNRPEKPWWWWWWWWSSTRAWFSPVSFFIRVSLFLSLSSREVCCLLYVQLQKTRGEKKQMKTLNTKKMDFSTTRRQNAKKSGIFLYSVRREITRATKLRRERTKRYYHAAASDRREPLVFRAPKRGRRRRRRRKRCGCVLRLASFSAPTSTTSTAVPLAATQLQLARRRRREEEETFRRRWENAATFF